jgi:hypothetical protein
MAGAIRQRAVAKGYGRRRLAEMSQTAGVANSAIPY